MVGGRIMNIVLILSTIIVLEIAIGFGASPMKILGKVNYYKGGDERKGFAEG
jgi:hypothetical protein